MNKTIDHEYKGVPLFVNKNQGEPTNALFNIPPVNLLKRQSTPKFSLDLDQNGESMWLYPGEDGKYEADNKSKEIQFDTSTRKKNSYTPFHMYSKEPINNLNKDLIHASNIANIIRNSDLVYTPKLEGNHRDKSNRNMSPEYNKQRPGAFPRNIFQINLKSRHPFP